VRTRIALCVAALAAASSAHAQVVETFNSSAAGFTLYSDATSLTWSSTVGNPPGSVRGVDTVSGDLWGFRASPAFLGDRACYYGGTLAWDLLVNTTTANLGVDVYDMAIIGPAGTLAYDLPQPTAGVWASRNVTLTEADANWSWGSLAGPQPTETQFRAVLADVTEIRFRAEYRNGSDNAHLDNVSLMPPGGVCTPACDPIDFNGDGLFPDNADLEDFFNVFGGGTCSTGTCNDIDFNNDGLFPDNEDLEDYLNVFGGGTC